MIDIQKLAGWTEDDAKALANTMSEPHMLKLRMILMLKAVPPADVAAIPGLDLTQVQAHAYSHSQGMVQTLTEIDALYPKIKPKSVGPPFRSPEPPKIPDPEPIKPE